MRQEEGGTRKETHSGQGKGRVTSTDKNTLGNPPRQLFGVLFIMAEMTLRIVMLLLLDSRHVRK